MTVKKKAPEKKRYRYISWSFADGDMYDVDFWTNEQVAQEEGEYYIRVELPPKGSSRDKGMCVGVIPYMEK